MVYFFGADDAPSCSKQNSAFDSALPDFKSRGFSVVGVRNAAGAKGSDVSQRLVVDDDDELRNEIGIPKDFFLLGGRETYVLNAKGEVEMVFNSQFEPEKHVERSLAMAEEMKGSAPANPIAELLAGFTK